MSETAKYIYQRAQLSDIGVFVINGEVKTLFPGGARFDLMMQDFAHRCAGVYSITATPVPLTVKMIQEDLDALSCES